MVYIKIQIALYMLLIGSLSLSTRPVARQELYFNENEAIKVERLDTDNPCIVSVSRGHMRITLGSHENPLPTSLQNLNSFDKISNFTRSIINQSTSCRIHSAMGRCYSEGQGGIGEIYMLLDNLRLRLSILQADTAYIHTLVSENQPGTRTLTPPPPIPMCFSEDIAFEISAANAINLFNTLMTLEDDRTDLPRRVTFTTLAGQGL